MSIKSEIERNVFRRRANALFAVVVAIVVSAAVARAELVSPYTPDADTLHIWHFDEADPGPALPAAGVSGSFNLTPDDGKSAGLPATLGNTGFTGFGTAGDTSAGVGSGFMGNSITVAVLIGTGGAFTFEAMIRPSNISDVQMIIGMDSNAVNASRPFQFRIDGGNLRLINIAGSSIEQMVMTIPTSGPDAFVANEWFHVAATYNGSENTADNFKLYWTRVDSSRTEANEIISMTMVEDLGGTSATFGVGNDYRTSGSGNTNNFEGLIDEVRISGTARAAGEMLFTIPEPSSLAFLGAGGLLISLAWRRRGVRSEFE